MSTPIRIAIFASGGGSNARNIWTHAQSRVYGAVALFVTHNPHSGVVSFSSDKGVPLTTLSPTQYRDGPYLIEVMEAHRIDLIVLAGYLKLVPKELVHHFADRILNIHPSLLPKYGGKGMYGMKVHEAVISNREKLSGMTIHYVNDHYDQGEILFQAQVQIEPEWTAQTLQQAVLQLEHRYYPDIIEKVCYALQNQAK